MPKKFEVKIGFSQEAHKRIQNVAKAYDQTMLAPMLKVWVMEGLQRAETQIASKSMLMDFSDKFNVVVDEMQKCVIDEKNKQLELPLEAEE